MTELLIRRPSGIELCLTYYHVNYFNDECPYHIESSPLISSTNQ